MVFTIWNVKQAALLIRLNARFYIAKENYFLKEQTNYMDDINDTDAEDHTSKMILWTVGYILSVE